jgi:hypothetical protein
MLNIKPLFAVKDLKTHLFLYDPKRAYEGSYEWVAQIFQGKILIKLFKNFQVYYYQNFYINEDFFH